MGSLTIAAIVFACTFGGALLGIFLRGVLPDSHLSTESKDVIKMGTGLVATLAALVLGLLIASAKGSIDTQRIGFQQLATNLILLDRSLKYYGPETTEIRIDLRRTVALVLDHHSSQTGSEAAALNAPDISDSAGELLMALRQLSPKTDTQKSIQSQALQISAELARTRWLLSHEAQSTIPVPFLIVLIFWLFVLFVTFGLFSPWNATVVTVLFICALSLAGAIFLIVELDQPFHGLIQVSDKPMRDAYSELGR